VGLGVWLLMDPLPFFFFWHTNIGHRRRRGLGPRSCTRRRSKACGGCSTGSTTRCRPPTPPRWDSTSSEAARNEEGCCSKPPTSVCVYGVCSSSPVTTTHCCAVYLIGRPDTNWRWCAPVASMMPSDEGSCVFGCV
jgi:hypothetical protein